MQALYMKDARIKHQAAVTLAGSSEINKKLYNWVQLADTIFHPKGGGQPSDEGVINGIKVAHVHKEMKDKTLLNEFEIYHCFEIEQPFPFKAGDVVVLVVAAEPRELNSRLHTAGHVLADAVNKCFPELEAYQGNHYPNNSYVRFKINAPLATENKEAFKHQIEGEFNGWIDQDHRVESRLEPSGIRNVKVFQKWSLCGGTHVESLKEIGGLKISEISINKKEGVVTMKYVL